MFMPLLLVQYLSTRWYFDKNFILQRGGDPLILCFVDFVDPACAATALSALQGYSFKLIIIPLNFN